MTPRDVRYKDIVEIMAVAASAAILTLLGHLLALSYYIWLPIIVLVILYVLISVRLFRLESSIRQIRQHPTTTLIEGESNIEKALSAAVKQSTEYLKCLGGRSRFTRYLSSIESRVRSKKATSLTYQRIVTGQHPSPQLRAHCRNVLGLENVEIYYMNQENLPSIVLTQDRAFLGLTARRGFTRLLKFSDERLLKEFNEYFNELIPQATPIRSIEELPR